VSGNPGGFKPRRIKGLREIAAMTARRALGGHVISAGALGLAEGFRLGPGEEGLARGPDRMGEEGRDPVAGLAPEEMELLEPRDLVEIGIPVTLDRIAAAHVDDPEAEGIIAAAAAAMLAADLGDPDAQDRVDDAEGLGLSWYASQELPILIEMI